MFGETEIRIGCILARLTDQTRESCIGDLHGVKASTSWLEHTNHDLRGWS